MIWHRHLSAGRRCSQAVCRSGAPYREKAGEYLQSVNEYAVYREEMDITSMPVIRGMYQEKRIM